MEAIEITYYKRNGQLKIENTKIRRRIILNLTHIVSISEIIGLFDDEFRLIIDYFEVCTVNGDVYYCNKQSHSALTGKMLNK
jgi:hypothetical protein